MPPESVLFAILLILVIGFTLAFLLIKKPHFRFLGRSFRTVKAKTKSTDDKAARKKPKPSPRYGVRTVKSNEKSVVPQGRRITAEGPKSQVIMSPSPPVSSTKAGDESSALLQSLQTIEKPFEPTDVAEPTPGDSVSTQFGQLHGSPPNCTHFFGYLRKMPKDATIPDGCLGCLKMVECLYYSGASE
ncbi:MAG: hypothetical protein NWE81_03080 [Candidatus Bathyarchaeota archaeon]|nr:hypothetical protein [Candidatus Bathyarchaeota archaeon]